MLPEQRLATTFAAGCALNAHLLKGQHFEVDGVFEFVQVGHLKLIGQPHLTLRWE